jgi:hypothetical protein
MMIPYDLVGQPLEVLQGRGYCFKDMSEEQKAIAAWWDAHYRNAATLPLQAVAEDRYKKQGYTQSNMTFISGNMPVWTKDGA